MGKRNRRQLTNVTATHKKRAVRSSCNGPTCSHSFRRISPHLASTVNASAVPIEKRPLHCERFRTALKQNRTRTPRTVVQHVRKQLRIAPGHRKKKILDVASKMEDNSPMEHPLCFEDPATSVPKFTFEIDVLDATKKIFYRLWRAAM